MHVREAILSIDSQWLSEFPLFEPLLSLLLQFGPTVAPPSLCALNQVLAMETLSFVAPGLKSASYEDAYESRIFLKKEVPTREHSWHDFFNALVWQRFNKTKRMINQLHYHEQQNRYPAKNRTPCENMLTLFDENGAVVIASHPHLLELIHEHRWHELFWQRREEVQDHLKVMVVGHGLYEKSLRPYVGLTAQCLLFVAEDNSRLFADSLVADYLHEHRTSLRPSLLSPLPLLGLPGWWKQNRQEEFYANEDYFRPKRLKVIDH